MGYTLGSSTSTRTRTIPTTNNQLTPPDKSFLLLDDILDQRDAEQLRCGTLAIELAAAKELLQDTRRKHEAAESEAL